MVITIRYIMKNGRGEVLEDRIERGTSYLHGSQAILPLLQQQLEGLQAGDKKKVGLLRESGLTEEDLFFDVVVDRLRPALPEEILLGYPVMLPECDEDCICYDGKKHDENSYSERLSR